MKILALTSRVPFPPRGGDRLRFFNFVKSLGRRHEITVLALTDDPSECKTAIPGVARSEIIYLPRYFSYLNVLRGIFSNKPLQVHYYRSRRLQQRIQEILQEQKIDLLFVHLVRMAEYANCGVRPRVLDLTDAISLNYERSREFEKEHRLGLFSLAQKIERRRVRDYEARVVSRFDLNLIISPVDRDFLGRFADVRSVEIVGPGVDLDYFSFYGGDYDTRQIIFVGKMSTFPNKDAALYFHESIFPLVLKRIPEARLVIAGIEPPPEILALARDPRVQVLGQVDDLRPHLHRSALSICPMRTGAGAKNKVLESLAAGTPVVSTSLGIEGIDLQHGEQVLLGDSPRDFADQVIRLIEDRKLRAALAQNGRRRMEQKYGWEVVLARLHELVDSLHARQEEVEGSST